MKLIGSFKKIKAYNLTLMALALVTFGAFSLGSAATAFASPSAVSSSSKGGGYRYIGQTTDSNGITFTLAACKVKTATNITVDSSYTISPVNPTTVAHSSIWEAYSNTREHNYLLYMSANFDDFNSSGTATDSFTTPKDVKTFMYWEGDYNPNGGGETNAGSGVSIPSPFKPFNVRKLHNC